MGQGQRGVYWKGLEEKKGVVCQKQKGDQWYMTSMGDNKRY